MDENLDFISQHDGLLELTINIMTSKECDYVKQGEMWANEGIIYWITHFLYSLTKDNPQLCAKLKGVEDIQNYITTAIEKLEESNIHICSNLSGLAWNLLQTENGESATLSEEAYKYVITPMKTILTSMASPQVEFNENFSENLESITGALSSNNEDEESITNDPKPTSAKLTQMLSDFLNEMGTQVKRWKNYALGNVTALELYSQILNDTGKRYLHFYFKIDYLLET